jgi:uncharacterized protein (TIGR02266 family)
MATILVADDTALFRAMLSDALREDGFEVLTAADGAEAFEALRDQAAQFDLAILDLEMPHMTGEEVLESLRDLPEGGRLPVLALTGTDFDPTRFRRLRELGALGYINKGASTAEILDRVQAALASAQKEPTENAAVEAYAMIEYRVDDQTYNGITHSLSLDGVFVRTIQPQPVGTSVHLSFDLPDSDHHVEANGVVVEQVPYEPDAPGGDAVPGFSVRWESMPPGSRAALEEFLRSRS